MSGKLSEPRIVCAANRIVFIDSTGNQRARVIAGARHHDGVMNPLLRDYLDGDMQFSTRSEVLVESKQGFIDQHGTFYSRQEAWVIAERNSQIVKRVGGDDREGGWLYSENLY